MATTGVAFGGNPETNEYDFSIALVDAVVPTEVDSSKSIWLYIDSTTANAKITNSSELANALMVMRAELLRANFPRTATNNWSQLSIAKEAGLNQKSPSDQTIVWDETNPIVNTGITIYAAVNTSISLTFFSAAGQVSNTRQALLSFLEKVENFALRNPIPYV